MMISNFPELRQADNWDCGASSLQSLLLYYGLDLSEADIINIAGTNKDRGTTPAGMIKAVEHYKFNYKAGKLSLTELKKYLNKKVPVILLLQAWSDLDSVDWKDHWSDGHYVVEIGYLADNIYFEDPYSFSRTFLSEKELEERWHDVDYGGQRHINWGLAICAKKGSQYPLKPLKMK